MNTQTTFNNLHRNELFKGRLPEDIISNPNYSIFPGFIDVHVHLREPGFSYKETIATGTRAAICGGYSTVASMPNLNPVPDSIENLNVQLDIIKKDALVNVYPFAAITKGQLGNELSDIDALYDKVIGFSDDGRGVQSDEMMEKAMLKVKSHDSIIAAHCEVNSLAPSPESEYLQLERDLKLVSKIGVRYHMCHCSTKESIDLIRQAKKAGLPVTCETAPHYLIFTENDVQDSGNYKMNPPIRGLKDKEALLEAICDGTIDMIATDHAPHSSEEKSKGFAGSLNGIVGLETAFPLMYTYLVKAQVISLDRLIELMSIAPRKVFRIQDDGLCVFDLNQKYIIDPQCFKSKGRSCPYGGMEVYGKHIATSIKGVINE
ncbi:MAG: dihydroorotase [Ruminococcaceae bacterium]|nr:dihydroorotase [Oscillospiraceae bacterium]